MKAVILAGGLGTRISEETHLKPKPMVEIGGKPILWHVMNIYSTHGISEFIICTGYKGYVIKEYFANYFLHMSDVTFNIKDNSMIVHKKHAEPWKVTVLDTGEETQTGGRLKRAGTYLEDKTFCLTYGDGLSDINIRSLIRFHRKSGKKATITGVKPPGRYGALEIKAGLVRKFKEKPQGDKSWINGGFFVLETSVLDYIKGDQTLWERDPLESLARDGELAVYEHNGFWQPMDTLREKNHLEDLWKSKMCPWVKTKK